MSGNCSGSGGGGGSGGRGGNNKTVEVRLVW